MVTAILAGNVALYHDLIRPYERSVYLMALSYLKNEADAEEVAQEAFLKAFRSLSSFRSDAKFSTWLISITLNEARGRLLRAKVARTESLDDAQDEGRLSPALLRDWREIPSEALENKELRSMLQMAVAALPITYRKVLLLRDVEEMSSKEAADALGISLALVKVRLHRARIMLQEHLAPQLKMMFSKKRRRWIP